MQALSLAPRRRLLQMEQQPQRHRLNREQQQQGSTEFQAARPVPAPRKPADTVRGLQAGEHDRAAARTGGHGGTPVDLPADGAAQPRDVKSYIREASANVDA